VPPTFTLAGHGGHREQKNFIQETDQTVLTIMNALTKLTNYTFRVKKCRGSTRNLGAFHFRIRSGAMRHGGSTNLKRGNAMYQLHRHLSQLHTTNHMTLVREKGAF